METFLIVVSTESHVHNSVKVCHLTTLRITKFMPSKKEKPIYLFENWCIRNMCPSNKMFKGGSNQLTQQNEGKRENLDPNWFPNTIEVKYCLFKGCIIISAKTITKGGSIICSIKPKLSYPQPYIKHFLLPQNKRPIRLQFYVNRSWIWRRVWIEMYFLVNYPYLNQQELIITRCSS